jgi:hypothetical protein
VSVKEELSEFGVVIFRKRFTCNSELFLHSYSYNARSLAGMKRLK